MMNRPVTVRQTALALALSFCFAAPALADDAASTVIVTSSRFDADPALRPIGATIITADDIRQAGVNDVNAAIRKIGGVFGRQNTGAAPDFSLDLRGFGTNGAQNVVVLVDGVRLSENELSAAVLSTIPIETVDHIEITRGGGSVLFGDGATGGVIQIFTKRAARNARSGSAFAELGQFKERDLRLTGAQSWEGFALDAAAEHQSTDNYRHHNAFKQNAFSGGAQWAIPDGRVGLRVESAHQHEEFAGSLKLAEFEADPRKTDTPNDFGKTQTDRVTAFGERRFGSVELAAELSHREKKLESTYVFGGFPSSATYESRQNQFSPRLRQITQIEGMVNEFVTGIDWTHWNRKVAADWSKADASQTSKAIYARDEVKFDPAHNSRLALGARHEAFDKDMADPLAFGVKAESSSQSQNAWEVQGSSDVAASVNVYAKAGQSYRVANVDENGYRSTTTVLKIQTSHDLEAGVTLGDRAQQVTARVFRHKLRNEIFFDPTLNGGYGANTNLDPTRRQGLELDGALQLAKEWRATAHAQHVSAQFTEGPNAGREIVLVPKNVLSARLAWASGADSADVGAQWVDSQRYGNDFANSCAARIPSYTAFDARYAHKLGPWEFAVSGLNLTDKQYFSNAYLCQAGIYPSDGRQLKFSVRYDFR